MDFDFALILTCLVLVSGAIWLLDIFVLRRFRAEDAKPPLISEYAISFFPVLAIVLVLRSFLFEPFQIPSESMVPTLEVGDFIVVNKFVYGPRLPVIGTKVFDVREPERGDVMVFVPPHRPNYFIKRIIGLPNDYIRVEDNQIYVNDVPLEQTFVATEALSADGYTYQLREETIGDESHLIRVREPATAMGRYVEFVVPEGHYYMMGDNRDNSEDSRFWGPVPEENIVGRAEAIWMNWRRWNLPTFDRVGGID